MKLRPQGDAMGGHGVLVCTVALEQFLRAGMHTAAAQAMAHLRNMASRGEAELADVVKVRTVIADSPGFDSRSLALASA